MPSHSNGYLVLNDTSSKVGQFWERHSGNLPSEQIHQIRVNAEQKKAWSEAKGLVQGQGLMREKEQKQGNKQKWDKGGDTEEAHVAALTNTHGPDYEMPAWPQPLYIPGVQWALLSNFSHSFKATW